MSDDEADEELLELLRNSLGNNGHISPGLPEIKVLEDAEFVYNNATDVALDMRGTKVAASKIFELMQEKGYSTRDWRSHELHPKSRDAATVDFIFLMDLLNFSFWSSCENPNISYAVDYRGKQWTGYWSLVAAIQRAIDEDSPITTPSFWTNREKCSDEMLRWIFRSSTEEGMPMLEERIKCIREAGQILQEVRSRHHLRLR